MSEALRMLRERIAEYGLGDRPSPPPAWMLACERELGRLLAFARATCESNDDICYTAEAGALLQRVRLEACGKLASLQSAVEEMLRAMSADPDGAIDWANIGPVLTSYAQRFDMGQDAIARLAEGWVSASYKLPAPMTSVLVAYTARNGRFVHEGFISDRGEWWLINSVRPFAVQADVTHWREMPPPPAA